MYHKITWKSDKEIIKLREQMRKDIIKEIQNTAGCRKCKKFKRIISQDLNREIR